ncbi:hypothetical protein SUGI_0968810 [Cryptomeria japonica]|nr:hypothetical protein SUGI_0968810 [Cryptomeria japonica]
MAKNMLLVLFVGYSSDAGGQFYDNDGSGGQFYDNGRRYNSESGYYSSKERTIDLFWKNLYRKIESISSSSDKVSNVTMYQHEVIKLLLQSKSMKQNGEYFSHKELFDLQIQIEDLTIHFEEKSVFKTYPSLIKLLIRQDMIFAKLYLNNKSGLSEQDLTYINGFGPYTLEAIIIHVLGAVYNCVQDLSVIRVSTLIHQIDSTVRVQAVNMGRKAVGKDNVKLSSNLE